MARDLILGTAGHIDHGKTSLVKALTGIDCDRLPEEKARGITIDIGSAHLDLGDYRLGIVDVPGHERFVKNMLAGASGLDLAMLVVAADDSVMPQTREHLEILRLLGLEAGLVVLTKCDLAEPTWLDLVEDDIHSLVAGTFLEGAAIVRTSSTTGQAINLGGVHHAEVQRGHELAAPGYLAATRVLSVEVHASADGPRPLRHRARYRVHLGTAEVSTTLALLQANELAAGGSCLAQMFL